MFEVINHNTGYQREDYIYDCVYLAQLRARFEISAEYPDVQIINFHTGENVSLDTRAYCQHCAYYGGETDCNNRKHAFTTPLVIA